VALLGLCACAAGPEHPASVSVLHLSDSALVTIPDASPDGRYTMSTIMGATQARDGAVAIWTASAEIYLFDSTGAYVGMPGRKGDGPEELRTIGGVSECNDGTFTAWDGMGRKLLFINAADGSIHASNPDVQEVTTRFAGCHAGHPVIAYFPFDFSSQELKQESLVVVQLDTTGTRQDIVYVGNGLLHAGPVTQLFPAIPVVRARADLLVVGDNTSDVLQRWHGRDRDSVRIRMARQPVTEAAADSMKQLWYDVGNSNARMSKQLREMIDQGWRKLPPSDSVPLFSALLIDDSASVWMSDYATLEIGLGSSHIRHWTRLSEDGSPTATLDIPPGFSVTQLTHGRALGIYENTDGSLSVEVRQIERP
jgi:hypothetical protein